MLVRRMLSASRDFSRSKLLIGAGPVEMTRERLKRVEKESPGGFRRGAKRGIRGPREILESDLFIAFRETPTATERYFTGATTQLFVDRFLGPHEL